MVAFGHTAVGALVGVAVYEYFGQTNPGLGLVVAGGAGILSHYAADFIPHGHFFSDKDFKKYIFIDIVFDLFLSIVLFSGMALFLNGFSWKFWYVLFGIGGSQFPDVVAGLYRLKILPNSGFFKAEHQFHESTHWHAIFKNGKLVDGLPLGKRDVWQAVAIILALLAILVY